MAAALLGPQVSAGVAPRSRPVPGEGVNDSDEGAGKYSSLAGNLPPVAKIGILSSFAAAEDCGHFSSEFILKVLRTAESAAPVTVSASDLPVPVLVNDVGDLDDLPHPELQLVLQLGHQALLHLGELLHRPPLQVVAGGGEGAVVARVRQPADVEREQACPAHGPPTGLVLNYNTALPPASTSLLLLLLLPRSDDQLP